MNKLIKKLSKFEKKSLGWVKNAQKIDGQVWFLRQNESGCVFFDAKNYVQAKKYTP